MKKEHVQALRTVHVIGHRNPDTDSVCAAIAYARLKNQLDPERHYVPCRAGLLNRETLFVLRYFDVPAPALYTDVSPQIQDAEYRRMPGADRSMSLRQAWLTIRDRQVDTLCVVDPKGQLEGVVTIKDMAAANMDMIDDAILSKTHTSYQNILETLNATVLTGSVEGKTVKGRIVVGTGSAELMERSVSKGDVVILGNRSDSQLAAIEMDADCIVVCGEAKVSRAILMLAEEKGCIVITTPYNTYVSGQMITQAVPISCCMVTKNLHTFTPHTPVEELQKVMAAVRDRYFPILDESGRYLGIISRRNLLNLQKKQVILVDHNERSQSVDGLEEAEILEIIDHHRLGALETESPVYFRNVPVGCTSTIIYQLYQENAITPDRSTAGLLLSAILSDTLMFRSPTCTPIDERAAQTLAELAGVDMEAYAASMFENGGDISGLTAEEILNTDYKLFSNGQLRFGVGQSTFMSDKNRAACEELVAPYLPTALSKQGLDYIFYLFTDATTSSTDLFMVGQGAEDLVRRAFHVDAQDGRATIPGLVSRKKQFIPTLFNAVKQLEASDSE